MGSLVGGALVGGGFVGGALVGGALVGGGLVGGVGVGAVPPDELAMSSGLKAQTSCFIRSTWPGVNSLIHESSV